MKHNGVMMKILSDVCDYKCNQIVRIVIYNGSHLILTDYNFVKSWPLKNTPYNGICYSFIEKLCGYQQLLPNQSLIGIK